MFQTTNQYSNIWENKKWSKSPNHQPASMSHYTTQLLPSSKFHITLENKYIYIYYTYLQTLILQHRQVTMHEGANGGTGGRQTHQRMEGGNLVQWLPRELEKSIETWGCSSIFMDFHGCSWIFMDFHGFSWILFLMFPGFLCFSVISLNFWSDVVLCRIPSPPMSGPTGPMDCHQATVCGSAIGLTFRPMTTPGRDIRI